MFRKLKGIPALDRVESHSPRKQACLTNVFRCADKNDAVVKYTLAEDQKQKIFASRYKLHLPSETELRTELRREIKILETDMKSEEKS